MTSAEPPDILTPPDTTGPIWTGPDDASNPPAPNEASTPPITRTPFQNSSTRALAEAMTLTNDPISVQRRWGRIAAINGDDTVNVILSGEVIEGIAYDSQYSPTLQEIVRLDIVGPDMVVVGPIAPSPRAFRRPVGDIEMSLVVKPDTLPLQGQVVSRTTYANLWAWVQDNSLVAAGMFTNGDGSTTFGLPDFRGRVPVGTGVFGGVTWGVGTTAGANSVTLATNQMPAHNHSVTVADHPTHTHTAAAHPTHDHAISVSISNTNTEHYHDANGSTSNSGTEHYHDVSGTTGGMNRNWSHQHGTPVAWSTHAAHTHAGRPGNLSEAANEDSDFTSIGTHFTDTSHEHGFGARSTMNGLHHHDFSVRTTMNGLHGHAATVDATPVSAGTHSIDAGGPTTHTVNQTTVGGTTPVDVRQPSIGIQFLIWV